nr:von Willebrand factor A domain-containing protein 5A-like [Paramormyrops kingsleyae]
MSVRCSFSLLPSVNFFSIFTLPGGKSLTAAGSGPQGESVPYTLSLGVHIYSPSTVQSVQSNCPLTPLEFLSQDNTEAKVSLSPGHKFDRDVELLLYYGQPHQPTAILEAGQPSAQPGSLMGDTVAMLSFYPEIPSIPSSQMTSKGEFIFVVDRSGSMDCPMNQSNYEQTRISSARDTLLLLLKSLPVGCYFNIYGFGSYFESYFPESVEYTQANMETAVQKVKSMQADMGGTEILQVLQDVYRRLDGSQLIGASVSRTVDPEMSNVLAGGECRHRNVEFTKLPQQQRKMVILFHTPTSNWDPSAAMQQVHLKFYPTCLLKMTVRKKIKQVEIPFNSIWLFVFSFTAVLPDYSVSPKNKRSSSGKLLSKKRFLHCIFTITLCCCFSADQCCSDDEESYCCFGENCYQADLGGGSLQSEGQGSVVTLEDGMDYLSDPPERQKVGDPLLELISLQKVDGSWDLQPSLASIFGKKEEEVATALPGKPEFLSVWATVLAVLWLHGHKMDFKDEWQFVAAKAVAWIRAHSGADLTGFVAAGNSFLGLKVELRNLGLQ